MDRDLDWEKLVYLFRQLPVGSRLKVLGLALRLHVAMEIVRLSKFRWALAIEGVVIVALIVLSTALQSNFFTDVALVAIGMILGGTFIVWLFRDIPRE